MGIDPLLRYLHRHNWEYERHNALMVRSCSCGIVEEGDIIEEPQLVSTSEVRPSDLEKVKWVRI